MALYEFFCKNCKLKFEQITSSSDPDQGRCPKCHQMHAQKLISVFAVGGRGDLRESTLHGCHENFSGCGHCPLGESSDGGHLDD